MKIQWVIHTLEWEPETLVGILWARQNVSEREARWKKSWQAFIDPYFSQNFVSFLNSCKPTWHVWFNCGVVPKN